MISYETLIETEELSICVKNRLADAGRFSTDYEVGAFLQGDGASPCKGIQTAPSRQSVRLFKTF